MSVYQLHSRRVLALCSALTVLALLYLGYSNFGTWSKSFTSPRLASPPVALPAGTLLDDVANATLGVRTTASPSAHDLLTLEQFQKIFIINLASRTDRRDAASLAAALTGLQVEFVDAATQIDDKAWPPGGIKTKLNAGGAGNWRSHMNAVEL